jgi:P-type Cu+ transporter
MTVTDPVCGMEVEEEDTVGFVEYAGQTYFFCSEECREEFEEAPEEYAGYEPDDLEEGV